MTQLTSVESNDKKLVSGITGISVCGYKSLYEECSIEIRPLTILAGANSSGKSSIMQPLLLMKQTLEASYDPGALLIYGSHIQFTLAAQFLSQLPVKKKSDSLTVSVEIDNDLSFTSTFNKHSSKGVEIIETTYSLWNNPSNKLKANFGTRMSHEDFMMNLPEYIKKFNESFLQIDRDGEKPKYKAKRERCFLELELAVGQESIGWGTNYSSSFQSYIRKLIHIPGLRGNPERTYKTTAIGREFPGTFDNYVASVLSYWNETKDERLQEIGRALETLGLTSKVDAKQINDVHIELRVGRSLTSGEATEMVSIADVGLGVSQVLPVLVALLVAEPGQLVYLEQPEVHLHPRAQAAMAEILADAAKRGVRVVLETHSELLLLAVQSLVAEGKLSPDLVKLHWFTRREDGVTEVNSAELDDAGAFGDWSEDFSDVSLKLESRYLNAAEAHLWQR
ncbi:MAG: AAA family ATPase [Symplocastrum torsivum CPER-KK1]|jgi:predicted ATPase|uniref:AAA family ATPase n=1 Tax=Symplocastrum torsivum CPER-KK1 TaxID=450513 RepID=A0A951PM20_9CYAN|nr:AAA family ATPase [Symplocastrum torsivum CPER-KK1]